MGLARWSVCITWPSLLGVGKRRGINGVGGGSVISCCSRPDSVLLAPSYFYGLISSAAVLATSLFIRPTPRRLSWPFQGGKQLQASVLTASWKIACCLITNWLCKRRCILNWYYQVLARVDPDMCLAFNDAEHFPLWASNAVWAMLCSLHKQHLLGWTGFVEMLSLRSKKGVLPVGEEPYLLSIMMDLLFSLFLLFLLIRRGRLFHV